MCLTAVTGVRFYSRAMEVLLLAWDEIDDWFSYLRQTLLSF